MNLKLLLFISGAIVGCSAKPQLFPDVQKFFQNTVIKPFKDIVQEGAQEVKGVINQLGKIGRPQKAESPTTSTTTFAPNTESTSKSTEVVTESESEVEILTSTEPPKNGRTSTGIEPRVGAVRNHSIPISSTSEPEPIISKLLSVCPQLSRYTDAVIKRYRWLPEKGTCFLVGFKGPCPDGMKLYSNDSENIEGICECAQGPRFYVYNATSNSCFKIFSQGNCALGEQVDLTKEGLGICKPNPCALDGENFVKVKGVCTEIGKPNPAICPTAEGVTHSTVDFVLNKRKPQCVFTLSTVAGQGILPCPPGSSIVFHGKCQPTDWDFGKEDD